MRPAERAAGEAAAGLRGLRPVRLRRRDLAGEPGGPRGPAGHQPAEGARKEGPVRHQQQHQDPEDVRGEDVGAGLQRDGGGGVRYRVLLRGVSSDGVRAAGEGLPAGRRRHAAGAAGRGHPAGRRGTRPGLRDAAGLGQRAAGPGREGGGGRVRRVLQLHEAEPSPAVPAPEGLPVRRNQQGHQAASGGGKAVPGTGCLLQAVEAAAQRRAQTVGKPNRFMFDCLAARFGVERERCLMVGDRLDTDILLGSNCGLKTLLTLTGVSTVAEAEAHRASGSAERQGMVPDYYVESIADLLPALQDDPTAAWVRGLKKGIFYRLNRV